MEGLSPRDFFKQRYDEEEQLEESLETGNKDVKEYVATKELIDSIDPLNYEAENKELAEEIKLDFKNLVHSTIEYIKAADAQEHFAKRNRSDITQESKDKLISLDADRTATHNMLFTELNILAFELKKLKVDNSLIRAIIGTDRKLEPKNQDDRRAVERWARNVSDYLATVSETTL